MASVNKVILLGNLGADPEVRYTQGGQAVCSLRIATNEVWNDRDGNRQERTEWHSATVWGKTAELCGQYLAKGRSVYLEGRLQSREYQDKEGVTRKVWEVVSDKVVFLGSRDGGGGGEGGGSGGGGSGGGGSGGGGSGGGGWGRGGRAGWWGARWWAGRWSGWRCGRSWPGWRRPGWWRPGGRSGRRWLGSRWRGSGRRRIRRRRSRRWIGRRWIRWWPRGRRLGRWARRRRLGRRSERRRLGRRWVGRRWVGRWVGRRCGRVAVRRAVVRRGVIPGAMTSTMIRSRFDPGQRLA
jgi:single-strand DNA-binding protein